MLITEEVCFPRERSAQGAHDLQPLLAKHGFIPGIAGHAGHGRPGLLHPKLVRSATRDEKAGLDDWPADEALSRLNAAAAG
jgi:D-lactate dehydrogenase